MAKYNLIKNGILRSITDDSYNKDLSLTELASLYNNDLVTYSVQLNSGDNLCLEADLGYRYKVDGISLYADDLTKLDNINFYYRKNDFITLYNGERSGSASSGNYVNAYTEFDPISCADLTKADGILKIDLKVNNISYIDPNDGQLEITSYQGPDSEEWYYSFATDSYGIKSKLDTSYKTFYIPLSYFSDAGGGLNVNKINYIRWYMKASGGTLEIYWRNAEVLTEDYKSCTKSVSDKYNAYIPDPSAVRFLRCTVSGINIGLSEFQIFNDDYPIGFGDAGDETARWIRDTPIGSPGTPEKIDIKNQDITSDYPVDAYVCVDYSGSGKDHYVEISDSENGEYLGFKDGAVVGYKYRDWYGGSFDNTMVNGANNLILDDKTIFDGTYTTSLISLDDAYMASYFIIDSDTEPNVTSVSKDSNLYNGTIEVRSSDEPYAPIINLLWFLKYNSDAGSIYKYDVYTDNWYDRWKDVFSGYTSSYTRSLCVSRLSGHIFAAMSYYGSGDHAIFLYDKDGNFIRSSNWGNDGYTVWFTSMFDVNNGVWIYLTGPKIIRHLNFTFSTLCNVTVNSLYDLAADPFSDSCWYTDRGDNTLVKLASNGAKVFTKVLTDVYGLAYSDDGGCWVSDTNPNEGYTIKKFDSDGNLVKTIITDKQVYRMFADDKGGFYARCSSSTGVIYHYNKKGELIKVLETGLFIDFLRGCRGGCILYDSTNKIAYWYDEVYDEIVWSKSYYSSIYNGAYKYASVPDVFYWDSTTSNEFGRYIGSNILPRSEDPVWYGNSRLEWKEVPKDGYFLPKKKYHQVRVTLRNYDGASTPVVKSISMAPAVKLSNIQVDHTRPVYVRTNIPADANVTNFSTRLKVWWQTNIE